MSDLDQVQQPSGTTGDGICVRFAPYDKIEIKARRLRIVKRYDLMPNWYVSGSGAEVESGPFTFEQVLELSKRALGEGPLLNQIAEIGRFEASRDRLREQGHKRLSLPGPEDEGVIQGITLSPGNYCSVGCAYCYAKPRFTGTPTDQTSDAVLENTFELIRSHSRVRSECTITIGGGGDGLENFAFYRRAVELSRHYERKYGLKVPIYLATVDPQRLVQDPEMIDLILENQEWITLSVDGDSIDSSLPYHRPRVDFRPLLERYGSRCHWGASAVFTARTAKRLCYNYLFLLEAGFDAIQMIPARLAESHPLHLGSEHFETAASQYRELLGVLQSQGRSLDFFSRLTTGDAFGRFLFRYLTEKRADLRCGAGFATVFADPLGRLFPCPSSSHEAARLGDLKSGFDRLPVLAEVSHKPEECLRCHILEACGGPCTHESLLLHHRPGQLTPAVCDFQRALCDLAVEHIAGLYNEDPGRLNWLFDSFVLKAAGVAKGFEEAGKQPIGLRTSRPGRSS